MHDRHVMQTFNQHHTKDIAMADAVSSEQLQNLLRMSPANDQLLIVDCRSFLAYNSSHISSAHNVHCPPIVKRRSGGSLPLQNILRCKQTRTGLENGLYSKVVVYDENTRDLQHLDSDSILSLVLKGLSSILIKCGIYFLYGGFDAFSTLYPQLCTSHISSESETTASPLNITQTFTTSPVATQEPVMSPTIACMQGDTIKYRPSQDQGDPEAILPWLFLGSAYHATQESRLQTLGINALLSLSRFDNHTPSGSFANRCIGVDDDCMSDIRCWFPEAIDFIESVRKNGGKVLVHCHAGISRSATVCIAYIMWLNHWTMECAYQFLKSKRSLIAPNLNFMRQLVEFENELEENGRGHPSSSTSTLSSSSSYASAVSCCECDVLPVQERPCSACANELGAAASLSSLHSTSPFMASSLRHDETPMEQSHGMFSSSCLTGASKTNSFSFSDLKPAPKSASAVLLSAITSESPRPSTAHPALFTLPLTPCTQQVFSFDPPVCSVAIHSHKNSPTLCHSPLLSPG